MFGAEENFQAQDKLDGKPANKAVDGVLPTKQAGGPEEPLGEAESAPTVKTPGSENRIPRLLCLPLYTY